MNIAYKSDYKKSDKNKIGMKKMSEKKEFIEYKRHIQLIYEDFNENDQTSISIIDDLISADLDDINDIENNEYVNRFVYYEKTLISNLKPNDYFNYRVVFTDLDECNKF